MKLKTIKIFISLLFFGSLFLDFISTNICLSSGFFEQNILFYVLSPIGFWITYWLISTGLFFLLFTFNKYSFIVMIIPFIVHTVCGINNFGLLI